MLKLQKLLTFPALAIIYCPYISELDTLSLSKKQKSNFTKLSLQFKVNYSAFPLKTVYEYPLFYPSSLKTIQDKLTKDWTNKIDLMLIYLNIELCTYFKI